MTEDKQQKTLDELATLEAFFTEAQTRLRSGQIVDMTGIDHRISAVCQTVQQAPPLQQQVYLPKLTALIDLLSTYEKELRAVQAAVSPPKPANSDDQS